MAILVMFSNYFHDLATAIFAVSAVTAYLLQRSLAMQTAPATVQPVVRGIQRMGYYSLAWTLVFGAFRGITYREYEWVEAVGRNQVSLDARNSDSCSSSARRALKVTPFGSRTNRWKRL